MEFQLNNAAVKDMVKVLRAEFPELKQTRGYEIVSKLFKQPNWDTLSGMLKASEQELSKQEADWVQRYGWCVKAPVIAEPIKLYAKAYSTGATALMSAPDFGMVTLTQELLDLIHATQTRVLASGIDESTVSVATAIEWDTRGTAWRLSLPNMTVTEDTVYFVSYPKHANFAVETVQISLQALYAILAPKGRGTASLDWADGIIFADDADDVKEFARELLYDEVIDIDEACIDKMAS